MGSSSRPQTITNTNAPPHFALPHLNSALHATRQQYAAGGPQVVPFSNDTNQALDMTRQRALNGSPVTQAGQDYARQVFDGTYMDQNPFLQQGPNPHLDATFDQAAQRSRSVLESEFARAGRNIGAAAPLRAEMLGDLATNIYGGAYQQDQNRRLQAYQSERNLQQGLVPFAPGLANQDYVDASQLASVGAQRESLEQQMRQQPFNSLDDYINRVAGLTGNYGIQSTSQPMYRNTAAGALGGGLTGLGATSALFGSGTTGLAALGLSNPLGWGLLGASALLGAS